MSPSILKLLVHEILLEQQLPDDFIPGADTYMLKPAIIKPPKDLSTDTTQTSTTEFKPKDTSTWAHYFMTAPRRAKESLPGSKLTKLKAPPGVTIRGGHMGYGTQDVQDFIDAQPLKGAFFGDVLKDRGQPTPKHKGHTWTPGKGSTGAIDMAIPLKGDMWSVRKDKKTGATKFKHAGARKNLDIDRVMKLLKFAEPKSQQILIHGNYRDIIFKNLDSKDTEAKWGITPQQVKKIKHKMGASSPDFIGKRRDHANHFHFDLAPSADTKFWRGGKKKHSKKLKKKNENMLRALVKEILCGV